MEIAGTSIPLSRWMMVSANPRPERTAMPFGEKLRMAPARDAERVGRDSRMVTWTERRDKKSAAAD